MIACHKKEIPHDLSQARNTSMEAVYPHAKRGGENIP